MRAVWVNGLDELDELVSVEDDQFHHLKNVLRVKIDDNILMLDGKGARQKAKVVGIGKKTVDLKPCDRVEISAMPELAVAVGVVKKEALEDICRTAVEMGVATIFLVQCEYSPWSYKAYPRLDKILKSAALQSNNSWLPKVIFRDDFASFIEQESGRLIIFDLEMGNEQACIGSFKKTDLLFLGPEGGFSESERTIFQKEKKYHLPTPIMRTVTAFPAALGLLLGCTR